MNIQKYTLKKFRKPNSIFFIFQRYFSYGPFTSTSFNPELCSELVNKQILPESVLHSFILTYKIFQESIQNQNTTFLEKISTPHFCRYLKSNFLTTFFNNKNLRLELENNHNPAITIENLLSYNVIYGLDLTNTKNKINYDETNLIPGTFLKKVLFYNKDSKIKTKIFCPPILVVDVIFATNLKPVVYENKRVMHKSHFNTYEKFVWQFVTYSKFKTYDVPFVVNEKNMEKFLDLKKVTEKENLNLISFSEKRQKEYETFGWKINNVNRFMPSVYKYIDF